MSNCGWPNLRAQGEKGSTECHTRRHVIVSDAIRFLASRLLQHHVYSFASNCSPTFQMPTTPTKTLSSQPKSPSEARAVPLMLSEKGTIPLEDSRKVFARARPFLLQSHGRRSALPLNLEVDCLSKPDFATFWMASTSKRVQLST